MSKPEFVFYWDRESRNMTGEPRQNMARLFRAYRRPGSGFRLWRVKPGQYCVASLGDWVWTTHPGVIGIFERRNSNV